VLEVAHTDKNIVMFAIHGKFFKRTVKKMKNCQHLPVGIALAKDGCSQKQH